MEKEQKSNGLYKKLKCLAWRAENFFIYNHMSITETGYLLGEGIYKEYRVKIPQPKYQVEQINQIL